MIVLGIILFILLVVVHEFGHFIVAKRNGVVPEEFGIGFPPKIWGYKPKNSETEYTLNLLPLGGFVKLRGESDSATEKGSFGAASFVVKAKIILAGVGMNVVSTFVIFLVLAFTSLPQVLPNQFSVDSDKSSTRRELRVTYVGENTPAGELGIAETDELVSINSQTFDDPVALGEFTKEHAGEEVFVVWISQSEEKNGYIVLNDDSEEQGYLGISTDNFEVARYGWSAPVVALGLTMQTLWLTLSGVLGLLGGLLSGGGGEAAQGVAGPIGVFFILQNVSHLGLEWLLFLIASISASLAVLNALPIPALDGGRIALIAIFRWLKKPLSEKIEQTINSVGFALLMVGIIAISIFDYGRFF